MNANANPVPHDAQPLSQDSVEDTLVDRGVPDPLDEGFSAPERWSSGEGFGTTFDEMHQGETLDQRLAQEVPDADTEGDEPYDVEDREVGVERTGRLVDSTLGFGEDVESDLIAADVGIDGSGSSAEEAAMHVIEDDDIDEDS
jgi:hypothetical protein